MTDETRRDGTATPVLSDEDLEMKEIEAYAKSCIGQKLSEGLTITGVLGFGGMGTVFRARKEGTATEYDVALKVLHPKFASSPAQVRRLQREAAVVAGLSHPNIITIQGDGLWEGRFFYYMELLEGRDLDSLLLHESSNKRQISWRRWIQWSISIAEAMDYAHKNGAVHRDLKPANIFLVKSGRVNECIKIMDFGLVLVREAGGREVTRLTMGPSHFGTPHYMAPEQALEAADATSSSDIYSLGAIMYEFSSGNPPFTEGGPFEIMMHHVKDEPAPVLDYVKDDSYPPALAALIHRMLAKRPNDRPRSMDQVVIELAKIADIGTSEPDILVPRLSIPKGNDDTTRDELPRSSVSRSGRVHRRDDLSVAPTTKRTTAPVVPLKTSPWRVIGLVVSCLVGMMLFVSMLFNGKTSQSDESMMQRDAAQRAATARPQVMPEPPSEVVPAPVTPVVLPTPVVPPLLPTPIAAVPTPPMAPEPPVVVARHRHGGSSHTHAPRRHTRPANCRAHPLDEDGQIRPECL